MNADVYIPPATQEKLDAPWAKGSRNHMACQVALPLAGNGMSESDIFHVLRSKCEADVTDQELQSVARWAVNKRPTPSAPVNGHSRPYFRPTTPIRATQAPKRTPAEECDWWTQNGHVTVEKMASLSPVTIPEQSSDRAILAFSSLYGADEKMNIVCSYLMDGEKAKPHGGGKTMNRDAWIAYVQSRGVPSKEAGGWIRINPCNSEIGTGTNGALTDADIGFYRYVLVESDVLPLPKQLALFSRLKLPIAAVIMSGGASAHAWVKVECQDEKEYKELAKRLLASLIRFGIDPANCNPSRLCRLPEATRKIGGVDGGLQQVLWLNPSVVPITQESLSKFEDTLAWPCVLDKPMLPLAQAAITRYEWMVANRGKLGVPTGICQFDEDTGGLKAGQTTVIAGVTGGGKSTLALHFITSALNAGIGVLLFSLEMDQHEIFDLIMAGRSRVSRNKFNNGYFSKGDIECMTVQITAMMNLPLFIEDSPMTTADQIRARIFQLKADNRIGLVVVDYIQFVNPGFSQESREQQVSGISHTLRAITREVQLPMVVLSQLNDEGKLRESRVVAHNANIVMIADADGDDFKVSIVKGRGVACTEHHLRFNRLFATLESPPAKFAHIDESDMPIERPTTNDP